LSIARLPAAVLDAFPSRLEIQYRCCEPLADAARKDEAAVANAGKRIALVRQQGRDIPAKTVFDELIGAKKSGAVKREVMDGDVKAFTVKDAKGRITIELPTVSAARLKAIEEFILKTLSR
jgi:ParB family chromosome partitioning protein